MIIQEKALRVGKQYAFIKEEEKSYGLLIHLKELPCKYGYHSYLSERLQFYYIKILKREYKKIESDCRE